MTAIWDEKLDGLDASEVHWSTSTILTIFFAASLVLAVFFGLGYSFGRGGITKATTGIALSAMPASPTPTKTRQPQVSSSKSILVAASSTRAAQSVGSINALSPSSVVQQPVHAMPKQISVTQSIQKPVASTTVTKRNAPMALTNATESGGNRASRYMVQVGAIGNRKDAQMLVAQLRKRGFHAGIYPGKRDKFLHVQIGPFANTQQAQSMRHKVLANGYHAMLKPAS